MSTEHPERLEDAHPPARPAIEYVEVTSDLDRPYRPSRGRRHRRVAPPMLAAAFMTLAGCGVTADADGEVVACGNRHVVVSVSGSERHDAMLDTALDVVYLGALSAVVCDEDFDAYAVAAGGLAMPLATSDDLGALRPTGSKEAREQRFSSDQRDELRALIRGRLENALDELPAETSAVDALYAFAAERVEDGDTVIVVSDFVHQSGSIDLNRSLRPGDGAAAAVQLSLPTLTVDVTIVGLGVAQLDSETAPPDSRWNAEIRAFAESTCIATGATCQMFTSAPATDALQPKETS